MPRFEEQPDVIKKKQKHFGESHFINYINLLVLYLLHLSNSSLQWCPVAYKPDTTFVIMSNVITIQNMRYYAHLNWAVGLQRQRFPSKLANVHLLQGDNKYFRRFLLVSDMVTMREACSLNERSLLYKCYSCIRLATTCNLSLRRSMSCYLNWCKLLLSGHRAGA